MKIIIEGPSLGHIKAACRDIFLAIPERAVRKLSPRATAALEQRRLLRSAFDLVRWNPEDRALVSNLAKALGGSAPVTDTLLETARLIVDESRH